MDHKETSVDITQYIEETLIPETLATYISMKRKDIEVLDKKTPNQRRGDRHKSHDRIKSLNKNGILVDK